MAKKDEKDVVKDTLHFLEWILRGYHPRNFEIKLWDGTTFEADPGENVRFRLILTHPGSLKNMLWPPTELNMGEAYIYGDFDIEGDIEAVFPVAEYVKGLKLSIVEKMKIGSRFMGLPSGEHPFKPEKTVKLKGKVHSKERDKIAIKSHYDVSNDFFSLWLDKNMVYSCAYFRSPNDDIDKAQRQKLDYIAKKLFLKPGERILDIGCGWGGFVIYAAENYNVDALGITLSENQYMYAKERISQLGILKKCRVEFRDYRDIEEKESFDKLVSIGMFEHVGEKTLKEYFSKAFRLLKPGGLFLNHGIAKRATDPDPMETTFSQRYVFPDGELVPISTTLRIAEEAGFEVRDVESLREHYAITLRHWVRRLEAHHEETKRATNEVTYRIWRLFMSGAAYGFKIGKHNVYQALLSKPNANGNAGLPLLREAWYQKEQKNNDIKEPKNLSL